MFEKGKDVEQAAADKGLSDRWVINNQRGIIENTFQYIDLNAPFQLFLTSTIK